MSKVYSKALDKSIEIDRIIDVVKGASPGPTVIFTGGIHGNEPSGIFALKEVMSGLKKEHLPVQGNIYALSGNLWALEKGQRFHTSDLNRLWTTERILRLEEGALQSHDEDTMQQLDLYQCLMSIMRNESGPFYFIDLHTTSSETIPFLTVNDTLLNRYFSMQFPVPVIMGIEEFLDGPLLSYINELGYVAVGFEAGQHDDMSSIENHVSFIYLVLVVAGIIAKDDLPDYHHHHTILAKNSIHARDIFEICYRYEVKNNQHFKMNPGHFNFQPVKRGQMLAQNGKEPILAPMRGSIFMPLYQDQGDDGFFIVRRVPKLLLRLSAILRKINFKRVVTLLPGVKKIGSKEDTLMVNKKIARFFARDIFHLLGYRCIQVDPKHLLIKSREHAARNKEYENVDWYNH
ncbi:succinylglutamate desuccinylase/aspartoacylase family protein [Fulvivirgaceae bacterium BMA10]|uniref:Succinylglutamate desuccinylase/aspartoacylase family protein n=1 Tax=Splendidivirga corallicola TaxID=3051826 RepID=A0ABT8KJU5_9BACT|nr:succinylglutamate desuccinylase/aspartoacylase family protein [Fulvivirgaceae bacterium BMA10]